MGASVPPELVYIILSFIPSGDKKTLCACTLVCQAWIPMSRERLFEDLLLSSRTELDLLVDRVLRSETMKPWLTHVARIRTYSIQSSDNELSQVANSFFHIFSGHLPNLHTLTLDDLNWQLFPSHRRISAAFSGFPSISKLELSDIHIHFCTLRRILDSLPSLTDLTCFGIKSDWSSNHQGQVPHLPARGTLSLSRLALRVNQCKNAQDLFLWLCRTPSIHTIRDLSLWTFGLSSSPGSDTRAFCHFIGEVAANVTRLETFPFGEWGHVPRVRDVLLKSTNLRSSLRFHLPISFRKADTPHRLRRRPIMGRDDFLAELCSKPPAHAQIQRSTRPHGVSV